MSSKVFRSIFNLFALLFILSGCTPMKSYDGPILPDDETAYAFIWSEADISVVEIMHNENEVSVFAPGFRMMPGEHIVRVIVDVTGARCGSFTSRDCFDFSRRQTCITAATFEAGKEYRVRINNYGGQAGVFIIDEDSKRAVGGGSCGKER